MPTPKRDTSTWVTYIYPFTIVKPDDEPDYTVPLEQINAVSYDHGKLCSFVCALDSGSESDAALVCFDGALALPISATFQDADSAQEAFNKILCSLLLGGVFCEAVDKRDIVWGAIHEDRCLWPVDLGRSHNAVLHGKLRTRSAGTMDTITLSNPKCVSVGVFTRAFSQGRKVLDTLETLSPTFLLRGHTELCYHEWSNALSNLWVVIEQLTALLWKRFLADTTRQPSSITKRLKSLSEDTRTWSTSVRQEVLFQVGMLREEIYAPLFAARKARNDLVHEGRTPLPATVQSLFSATVSLVESASKVEALGIRQLPHRDRLAFGSARTSIDVWRRVSQKYATKG